MTAENDKFIGLVVFWVNLHDATDVLSKLAMIKEMNKPLFELLSTKDGRYEFLFIPTFKESTRIEKIDYDLPFPRCMALGIDVQKYGLQVISEPKDDGHDLKGLITLFINFPTEMNIDIAKTLELVRNANKETFDTVDEDGRYKILIVPTSKEGSRAEKVDWGSPFPRMVSGATVRANDEEVPEDDDDDNDEDGDK